MSLTEDHKKYMKEIAEKTKYKPGDKVVLHKIDDNILLDERYKVGEVVTLTYTDPYEGWHGKFSDGEEWSLVDCVFHKQVSITDNVNSPSHYEILPGVEMYDIREAILSKHTYLHPCVVDDWSRASEYLLRMFGKNGLEDAKKARWYLNKLIERMENG